MLHKYIIKSERPSPVIADVGTKLSVSSGELFSQYRATFSPISANASVALAS